jgi:hypothetical protein
VKKEDKHILAGLDEIEALTRGIRNGSGVAAIVIYVDETKDAIKINMASFNMASLGVMLTLVEAVKMIGEDLKEDMHESPGTLQ